MSLRDLLSMAKKNLLAKKLRTGLTLLGVVIGCVSIIIMMSFGYGMEDNNRRMIEGFGDVKNIDVLPGEESTGGAKRLTAASIKELEKISHVTDVSPVYQNSFKMQYKKFQSDFGQITALDKKTMELYGWKIDTGSKFSGDGKGQILFGKDAARQFYNPDKIQEPEFDEEGKPIELPPPFDAAGKELEIAAMDPSSMGGEALPGTPVANYKVVGVLEETKKMDYDMGIFMTIEGYSELMSKLAMEKPSKTNFDNLRVRIDDMKNAESVSNEIKQLGYKPQGMIEIIKDLNQSMAVVNGIFAGIGSISFIVAAIGIANTMIMSIYERTREIGVMKVIGASIRDIQKLFLVEAGMIGLIGGVFGVLTSLLLSLIFNALGNQFAASQGATETITFSRIPFWLVLVGLGFSTLVGVLAGYFPAKRAMNLSALDAIRSE